MSDTPAQFSIAPVLTSVSFILLSFFVYLLANASFDPARKEAVQRSIAREFSVPPVADKPPPVPRVIDDLLTQRDLGTPPTVHRLGGDAALAIVFSRNELFEEKSSVLRQSYRHLFTLLATELAGRPERVEILFAVDPLASPVTEGNEGAIAQLVTLLPLFSKDAPAGTKPQEPRLGGAVVNKAACDALQFHCTGQIPHEAVAIVLRRKGASTPL